MKERDYYFLASDLKRYFVQYRDRVNATTMLAACKGRINKAEAKRLIDYYLNVEHILEPVTRFHYRWTNVHQDHFNCDAIRDIFLKYDIASQFGRKKGYKPALKAELVIPTDVLPVIEDGSKEEPVEDSDLHIVEVFTSPLRQYSTENLLQELSLRGYKVSLEFSGLII